MDKVQSHDQYLFENFACYEPDVYTIKIIAKCRVLGNYTRFSCSKTRKKLLM